ncbi:MAG: glycosyltransferase family 4 protein [Clostridiales bacterium]|nr:glycosyltransferase family 4 protein [Clostridiales bacterium]
MTKKILILTPMSRQVVGFRAALIEKLQSEGHTVAVITLDNEKEKEIVAKNIEFHCINGSNRSINPFKLSVLTKRYAALIEKIKPDIVMTFMIKPNIYGALAAARVGVKNLFCMVEGAGDVFTKNGLKWKLMRKYVCFKYKKSFKHAKKVFFLNNDDKSEFIARGLVKETQCEIIPGIGIDVEEFAYKPFVNDKTFLMVARMLKTKGVIEYCKAARAVKKKYPEAVFNYLGGEGDLTVSDIKEYIDDGSVNYLGTTNDVRPFYEDCTALVLPTYREGFPVCVMEAMAMGRAVIASDTNGCRDAVKNDENGFLVETRNVDKLIEKIVYCIEHTDEIKNMGEAAHGFAVENFDGVKINEQLYGLVMQ